MLKNIEKLDSYIRYYISRKYRREVRELNRYIELYRIVLNYISTYNIVVGIVDNYYLVYSRISTSIIIKKNIYLLLNI